jgi:hypothetical protein
MLRSLRYDIYPARGRKLAQSSWMMSAFWAIASLRYLPRKGTETAAPAGDRRSRRHSGAPSLRYLPRKGTETPCSKHTESFPFSLSSLRYLPRKGTETTHPHQQPHKAIPTSLRYLPRKGTETQCEATLVHSQIAIWASLRYLPRKGTETQQDSQLYYPSHQTTASLRYLPRKGTETTQYLTNDH